jgi:hypothetical protein
MAYEAMFATPLVTTTTGQPGSRLSVPSKIAAGVKLTAASTVL